MSYDKGICKYGMHYFIKVLSVAQFHAKSIKNLLLIVKFGAHFDTVNRIREKFKGLWLEIF